MQAVRINIDGVWHNKKTLNAGAIIEDADDVLIDLAKRKVLVDGVVMVTFIGKTRPAAIAEESTHSTEPTPPSPIESNLQPIDPVKIEGIENIKQVDKVPKAKTPKVSKARRNKRKGKS